MTRIKHSEAEKKFCQICGGELPRRWNEGSGRWSQRKYHKECARTGKHNPRWKGGRNLINGYYTRIHTGSKTRIFEHRLMAEAVLGRPLKANEIVHHINCDKADNRNSNFLICNRGYHKWLHDEMGRRYAQEHFCSEPDVASILAGLAC